MCSRNEEGVSYTGVLDSISHPGFFILHRSRELFLQLDLTGQDPWLDTSTYKEKIEFSIRRSVKGRKATRSAQSTIKHARLEAAAVV
jgi:hypothetical protein